MDHDDNIINDIVDIKVYLARIDERSKSSNEKLDAALKKVDVHEETLNDHAELLSKYRSDRNWIVGIFSTLFTGAIALTKIWK